MYKTQIFYLATLLTFFLDILDVRTENIIPSMP